MFGFAKWRGCIRSVFARATIDMLGKTINISTGNPGPKFVFKKAN